VKGLDVADGVEHFLRFVIDELQFLDQAFRREGRCRHGLEHPLAQLLADALSAVEQGQRLASAQGDRESRALLAHGSGGSHPAREHEHHAGSLHRFRIVRRGLGLRQAIEALRHGRLRENGGDLANVRQNCVKVCVFFSNGRGAFHVCSENQCQLTDDALRILEKRSKGKPFAPFFWKIKRTLKKKRLDPKNMRGYDLNREMTLCVTRNF